MYPVGYTLLKENSEYVEREDEFDVVDEDGREVDAIAKPKVPSPCDPDAVVDVGDVEDAVGVPPDVEDALPVIFETKRQRKHRRRERVAV